MQLRVDYINPRHLSEFHNSGQRWTQPRFLAPLRELEKTTLIFMPSSDLGTLLCYAPDPVFTLLEFYLKNDVISLLTFLTFSIGIC